MLATFGSKFVQRVLNSPNPVINERLPAPPSDSTSESPTSAIEIA